MLGDLQMFLRFAGGLRRFLRSPLSFEAGRQLIQESIDKREDGFLKLVRLAVYNNETSPYRALLKWAGVEYGDLERLTRQDGVEGALLKLHAAGVYVSLEVYKGQQRIERPGLSIQVSPEDFDNPLLAREFEVQSGGSTGRRRRLGIDFDHLVYETALRNLLLEFHGLSSRPFAIWRAVPPGSAGIKIVLATAKSGHRVDRWFSPTPVSWQPKMLPSAIFTHYSVLAGRAWGGLIPRPIHVPLDQAERVAMWLRDTAIQGRPALISLPANSGARVCAAAKQSGLDISGTSFWMGGEPMTQAKYRLVREVGADSISGWAMSETGLIAIGCGNREAIDEVHLCPGKVAVIQRQKMLDERTAVDALFLTTLLTSSPKILLNLDTGDYGTFGKRRCGCPLEELGFDQHLHTIRNYDKLTAGGMQFLGSAIMSLVEEVLPAAHGGHPSDYQLQQEEVEGMNRVSIVVSPRVAGVNDDQVVKTVLDFLGSGSRGDAAMSDQWRQGAILRVIRREPYATPVGKIPPLRVVRGQSEEA